jgi:hypothetical protein
LSINRTVEYVVLWKSHKRAEWAAVGLDNQVATMQRRLGRESAPVRPPTAEHQGEYREEYQEKRRPVAVADRADRADIEPARTAAAPFSDPDFSGEPGRPAQLEALGNIEQLELLEQESHRMWKLHSEIGSELAQAAALLTVAQRKSAEKVLKQWEKTSAEL